MTMIIPAGNNKLVWSPKETKLQKVASDGQEVEDIEVDALYEAAKGVMAAEEEKLEVEAGSDCKECGKSKCKCEDECKCEDPCKCASTDDEVKEASEKVAEVKEATPKKGAEVKEAMFGEEDSVVVLDVEEVTDTPCEETPCEDKGEVVEDKGEDKGEVVEEVADESKEQSVSEAVAEVEAKAEEAEAVVEQVVEALDQIEEAVEGVKAVCGNGDEAVEGEDKGEVVENADADADANGDDIPGEKVVDSEVIVEGEECEASDEVAMDKSASTEEFCKYAKLSSQNRSKLNNYWTNMLGYPKDFVNLMTKDYEK